MIQAILARFTAAIFLSKAFYFCFFAAVAALLPFLVLYYEQLGLSGQQIGLLTGLPPLVTMVSASFWGGLADATQRHRLILYLALGGVMTAVSAFTLTTQFWGLLIIVIGMGFFSAPVMPLVDNAVLEFLGPQTDRYGKVRLWGTIGFGLFPPLVGVLVAQSGLQFAFGGYLGLMTLCLLIITRLPIGSDRAKQTIPEAKETVSTFWHEVRTLLRNQAWGLFLVVILISGMSEAVINNFLFLYLNQLEASEALMGIALTVAMGGEITIFLLSERLLKRWGTYQLLTVAFVGHGLRLWAYSVITLPWLVLPVQLLHGFTFALIWITAVSYAKKLAPSGLGATAQGILNSIKFGLGYSVGSLVGGLLYEQVGPFMMFFWTGVWVFFGVGLLLVAPWLRQRGAKMNVPT